MTTEDYKLFAVILSLLLTVFFSFQTSRNSKKVNSINAAEDFGDKEPGLVEEVRALFRENEYQGEMPLILINATMSDPESRTKIIKLLNLYESLSRGVNLKAYDEKVIKISRKTSLITTYTLFKNLSDDRRKEGKNSWSQFEKLAKKWL